MKVKRTVLASLCLFFCCICSAFAQQKITGTVIDANSKEPIIGASVLVKGTNTGIMSDIDGNFTLTIKTNNAELVISYVGYKTQTVPVDGRQKLIVEMSENTQELDQVVVIGYGVQKKSDLTGSVASVNADDVSRMPTTNVAQALQGKAAGVEIVQNSGSPGASTSVRIRGTGTVNNSDPLYVVDGMAMENINFLSSDDIASIEILKDAASSAIYGSRAANGVVLITTKSGKESGKPNINLNIYMGWQEPWKNPDIMSKDEYIYFYDYSRNIYGKTELGPNGKLQVRDEALPELAGGTDWWDEVTRKGFMQKYNLAVNGGTDKINYYVSGSYLKTDGIVKESDYDRKSLVTKLNAKLSNTVTLGVNLNYANEDRSVVDESGKWGVIKQALNTSPLVQLKDPNGTYTWSTPVEVLRRATFDAMNNNFIGQLTLDWDIVKGLRFNTRASYGFYGRTEDHFSRYNIDPGIVGDIKYDVKRVPSTTHTISWDNVFNYNITIDDDHDLSLLAGQTFETLSYEYGDFKGTGYGGYDSNYDAFNFATFNQAGTGYSSSWRALGFIGRVSYNYKSKYLLQANFRADASSRFAKDRWGYFPSVSAGWKISGEDFMNDISWISLLKLRAGWGQLGNNRIGDNAYGTYVSALAANNALTNYIYGVVNPSLKPGMSITQFGNRDITWERTQSTNVGLDFNVLNNRLSTNIDFFIKDTKDMLLAVPIVYSAGFANIPLQNAGSVNNKGYEIQINWKDQVGGFRYEIGANFTQIKNKVTSLGEFGEPILGGSIDKLGYLNKTVLNAPIGAFYGWKTAGIIQEGEDVSKIATFKSDKPFVPGDMKFVDINKDGVIDDNDKTFLGSPHPDFYYGFNINLEYKGFDLSMFFQGIYGNKIYNAMKYYSYTSMDWNGRPSNVAGDYMSQVWRGTASDYRGNWGPNTSGAIPAPSTDPARNEINFRNSDMYVEDGSYLRLKNIQLGYNLPKSICQKWGIGSLRIYAAATNLFTITNYTGLDPEIGKTSGQESNNLYLGIDEGTYPQARSYTFGLIFDF